MVVIILVLTTDTQNASIGAGEYIGKGTEAKDSSFTFREKIIAACKNWLWKCEEPPLAFNCGAGG